MPSMNEIYKNYAEQYDRLVKSEDYQGKFSSYLKDNIEWDGKIVLEAGIGTGRVTEIFISRIKKLYGFDRENHMIQQCEMNLIGFSDKVILAKGSNENLPKIQEKADIFIEGWSFGHTISENRDDIPGITSILIENIRKNTVQNSVNIIIETLGTNVDEPIIKEKLREFYNLLENEYGYKRDIVETDYMFTDYNEAAEILGFFFGEKMGNDILEKKKHVIHEFTGIWILNNSKQ